MEINLKNIMMKEIIPQKFLDFSINNYPVENHKINFEAYFYNYFFSNNISSEYNYIPIQWTNYLVKNDYGKDLNEINNFLNKFIDKSKKYFTVVQYAGGPLVELDNTLIFSMGGAFNTPIKNKSKVIPLPLIYQSKKYPNNNYEKKYIGSYIGRPTHNVRIKLEKKLSKDKSFFIKNLEDMNSEISIDNQNIFKKTMLDSYFSICPRGFGPTSFRLYESIINGVVPVYISNNHFLPFEDKIDWNKFSIILKPRSINNISKILKKEVDNGGYDEMKIELDNIKDIYFNFDFMSKYVCEKIS